jgi:signal transduction histidine kinase
MMRFNQSQSGGFYRKLSLSFDWTMFLASALIVAVVYIWIREAGWATRGIDAPPVWQSGLGFILGLLVAFGGALKSTLAPPVRRQPGLGEMADAPPRAAMATADICDLVKLLQSTLDALPTELSVVDAAGDVIAVNEPARRFIQETRGYGWGAGGNFLDKRRDFVGEELDDSFLDRWNDLVAGRLSSIVGAYDVATLDGVRSMQVCITRFSFGRMPLLIVANRDVTEITQARGEVDSLSRQLLATQEDERRRIAVELHDSTGQHLTVIGLALERMRSGGQVCGVTASAMDDASRSLGEAHKEIRLLSYLLHPPCLEEEGLVKSLERFAQGFSRRAGLECRFLVKGRLGRLDFELQRTLYRVAQEALTNVHRHADATRVELELLRHRGGLIRMTVKDNGAGARTQGLGANNLVMGVGIPGMKARLRQFGGNVDVLSTPSGVTVTATVPSIEANDCAIPAAAPLPMTMGHLTH